MADYKAERFKSFANWNGFSFSIPPHSELVDFLGNSVVIGTPPLGDENYLSTVDHYYNLAEVKLRMNVSTTTKPSHYEQAYVYHKDSLPSIDPSTPQNSRALGSTPTVDVRYIVSNQYDSPTTNLRPRDRLAAETTGALVPHEINTNNGLIESSLSLPDHSHLTSAYITSGTAIGPSNPPYPTYGADFRLPITHQVFMDGTSSSSPGTTYKTGVFVITSEENVADHFASNSLYGTKSTFNITYRPRIDLAESKKDADLFNPTKESSVIKQWYIVPRDGFEFDVANAELTFEYYTYAVGDESITMKELDKL